MWRDVYDITPPTPTPPPSDLKQLLFFVSCGWHHIKFCGQLARPNKILQVWQSTSSLLSFCDVCSNLRLWQFCFGAWVFAQWGVLLLTEGSGACAVCATFAVCPGNAGQRVYFVSLRGWSNLFYRHCAEKNTQTFADNSTRITTALLYIALFYPSLCCWHDEPPVCHLCLVILVPVLRRMKAVRFPLLSFQHLLLFLASCVLSLPFLPTLKKGLNLLDEILESPGKNQDDWHLRLYQQLSLTCIRLSRARGCKSLFPGVIR